MAMKKKCIFLPKHKNEFPFLEATDDASFVNCIICSSKINLAHGGRGDIVKHCKTSKHIANLKAGSSSKKDFEFFQTPLSSDDDLKCAATEATFAYHSVQHDISI
jgi:hypothetical protein